MKANNELDDFFRSEFEKNSFEYKESDWLKAEQLIIDYEKKERNRKILFYFFLITILSVLTIGVYNYKNNKIALTKDSPIKENNNHSSQSNSTDHNINSFSINHIENNVQNEIQNSKIVNNKRIIAVNKNKTIISKNLSTIKTNLNTKKEKAKVNIEFTPNKNDGTNSNITKVNTPFFANSNSQHIQELNHFGNEPSNLNYTDEMILIDGILYEAEQDMNVIVFEVAKDTRKPLEKNKQTTFAISILAGASAFKGFTPASGFAIHPIAGIGVNYKLSNKFCSEIGLLYTERGDLNSTKQFYSEMYDFGYSNETATITAKKLIYINIPVLLKYNFSFSQSLIAGVSICKLLNSKSTVTSTIKNDNGSLLTKSSKETGYVNGFNKYDLGITAGYENKLIKNLFANIRLNYGLIDITKNSYFENNSIDKNISVSVMLRYIVFEK